MSTERVSDYDELPYPSLSFRKTHPDRLAVVARLLGLNPARADRCRVLELGCGSGGNVIPMAYSYPDSTFLGVDLSAVHISRAESQSEALQLKNVRFRSMNILDLDESLGEFDYIICHGVYSWVPEAVQDRILEILAQCLAAEGLGYVSYNTFPGWYIRGMIRSMMLLRDRRYRHRPAKQRITEARALLAFLAEAFPVAETPFATLLRNHHEWLRDVDDSAFFHEWLEKHNEPIYFVDFCERLERKGLRYLGEATFGSMVCGTQFSPEIIDRLRAMSTNLQEMEQYADLISNRPFRQTLICRDRLCPNYDVKGSRLAVFRVASRLRSREPEPDLWSNSAVEFVTEDGFGLTTPVPIVKAALKHLGEIWPRDEAFTELLALANAQLATRTESDSGPDAQALGKAVLTAFAKTDERLVDLRLNPPAVAYQVSMRPVGSFVARMQVAEKLEVTNLRNERVVLAPLAARLLCLLDGTRAREDLLGALVESVRIGQSDSPEYSQFIGNVVELQSRLGSFLDKQLAKFVNNHLLIA